MNRASTDPKAELDPDAGDEKPASRALLEARPRVAAAEELLLVTTLDGRLHALDCHTGALRWTSDVLGGPLVQGSGNAVPTAHAVSVAEDVEPLYLLEPVFPGYIYAYVPGQLVQVRPLLPRLHS